MATRRVRVSPELVEVREGAAPETRWQQSYDTTLADVFDVQSAVAIEVADKLGVVLSPPAQTQLAARPTQNLAAYDCVPAQHGTRWCRSADVRLALATAEQAVALDSGFAAAWARVSTRHARTVQCSRSRLAPTRTPRARRPNGPLPAPLTRPTDTSRADSTHSSSHTTPRPPAPTYETALRLAPSSSEAVRWLAAAGHEAAGQWAPALDHARQAVALDPRSTDGGISSDSGAALAPAIPGSARGGRAWARLAPADLALTEHHAMSQLGDGDIAGRPSRASGRSAHTRSRRAGRILYHQLGSLVAAGQRGSRHDVDAAARGVRR